MPPQSHSHLSPHPYDDDTSSIHSVDRSDQDTDSEDDNVLLGARTSADIRTYDRTVLEEEEERDRLLEESRKRGRRGSALKLVEGVRGIFGKSFSELPETGGSGEHINEKDVHGEAEMDIGGGKRERRRRRRERRQRKKERLMHGAQEGEDGELMYEMEEGGLKAGESTGSSSDSEEIDRVGLHSLREDKSTRRRKWRRWCFIHLLILVGFAILVLLAWKLSLNQKGMIPKQEMRSNGTALFAPTTILISLDGFRADFLKRGITPRLNKFVAEGVSPSYMLPSFPSVTFPNHYTLVTGLYPESHGVVGNTFWDEELKEEFFYTNPLAMSPKWWGGEPLWVTAEAHGIRTAIHMWPGSEAGIMDVKPAFLDKYNGKELLPNKVKRILELLDKPGIENDIVETVDMRPQLIAAYVPNVDSDGHSYGPNSTEILVTINDVDNMLDHLFQGLDARNLTDIVNVVVVSDHGMATTDTNRLIQLEDIIDTSLIEHMDGWPLYGLRPKDPAHLQGLYDVLAAEASVNPNFDVYLRDKNMPDRYHFSKNERIAPLWVIPKTGWAIVTKDDFNVKDAKEKGTVYKPKGLHGYDHEHPLMRAIFVARGPAFPHEGNSRVEPFQNIEVYNIICDSLNIPPKPNNGTFRLPLKTVGFHTPDASPETPADPPISTHPSLVSPSPLASGTQNEDANAIISISPIEASSAADPNLKPPSVVGVNPPEENGVERPAVEDTGTGEEAQEEKDFLEWVKEKLEGLKGWLGGLVSGGKEGDGKDKGGETSN